MHKKPVGRPGKIKDQKGDFSSEQQAINESSNSLKDYQTIIRALEASNLISIVKTDMQGNYTFVNDSFCREFGFKREELIGFPSLLTVVKEDWPLCIATVEKCAKNIGVPQNVVLRKPTAVNEIRGNEWEFTMIADENGIPYEVVCVGFSVADKIKAEQDYSLILSNFSDVIVTINRDGFVTYVSPSITKIYGFRVEHILGKHFSELEGNYNCPDFSDVFEKIDEKNSPVEIEHSFNDAYGNEKWSNSKISVNPLNNEFIIVTNDITHRKTIERDLQQKSTIIQTILKTAPIGIWMQNRDGKFLFVNESFCKNIGVTEEQFLEASHYSKLLDPDSASQCMLSDKMSYSKDEPSVSYEKIKFADGELHDLKVIKTRMIDNQQNPAGLVGISVDISELKRLEEQLKKAKETAESASRLKDAFLENISHELRTPLQGILGTASILQEAFEDSPNPEFVGTMASLENVIFRLLKTVDTILNFTQLQMGDFSISPKQINLSNLLANIERQYRVKAEQKGIRIDFLPENQVHIVNADENSVLTAFAHLIDNAVKFTPSGKVLITIKETDQNTIVTIEDSGVGMSQDYQKHLFEPYSQQSIGRERDFEGLGLGLSIVKRLLDLNNVNILIESKESVGTKCFVTFPKNLVY